MVEPQLRDKEHNPYFEGPIETGQIIHPPEPQDETDLGNNFRVKSQSFTGEAVKIIQLPKFVTNPDQGLKEKSFLLLNFDTEKYPRVYKEILQLVADGKIVQGLEIELLDDDDKPVSTWKFEVARLQAADFGYFAKKRAEPTELIVEISYNRIDIDGVTI